MMFGHAVDLRAEQRKSSAIPTTAINPAAAAISDMDDRADDVAAPTLLFDIEEQLLEPALEKYATVTGVSVLYNSKLTDGIQSHAVKGVYTVPQALRIMLDGTGLTERRVAPGSMVLMRDPADSTKRMDEGSADYRSYYGRVQDGVRERFCSEKSIVRGNHRIAMRLWIGPPGDVEKADLLDSTGDPALDRMIVESLRHVSIGAPPPAGMTQPMTMLVLPDSKEQPWGCPGAARQ
jgi:Secretin and TonB N terminus short domain/TonB C terminal